MAAIAPSVITLIGTVAGGLLAGGAALWSAQLTRKRDAEADYRRFELDRRKARADQRDALYTRWLQACHDIENVIRDNDPDELKRRVRDFEKLGEEVKAHSSDELDRHVDLCIALRKSWLEATDDVERATVSSHIVDQRLATAAAVRSEIPA
jgi:tRNA A37 N6-isopentenylltransferase MiaA